jgi:UDP-N-acetylglucosamine--N-acetylmuramyl-(pentapeptide) pyrophosphoryl-undecaprenol N-acetylglucosamine transferase
MTSPVILLAAGGTGGHVMPALALADELHNRGAKVIFASDIRGAKYVTDRPWMTHKIIRAGTLRKHPIRFFTDIANIFIGLLQSFDLIRRHRPDVVVGFGGYPCFPPMLAAQIMDIPTLLHEQNAVLGKANGWLASMSKKIALSLPDFTGLSANQQKRAVVTGRPVRTEIAALYDRPYIPPTAGGDINILIIGGSLGAKVLSRDLPPILAALPANLRARLNLTHQILNDDLDAARTVYQRVGIRAHIAPFFTDMPAELNRAHLFIGRSGGTVAEICCAGLPAIYIPYPHHKDQQQLKNAAVIEQIGGAVIIKEPDLKADTLLAYITDFMQNPDRLAQMSIKARSCGYPRAAQSLADAVLGLVSPV